MSSSMTQPRQWTAITVPRTGEFQTVYKKLERVLRERSELPMTGKIPMHVVALAAMKHHLETLERERG